MSQADFAVDNCPAALPFEALVETLISFGVSFRRKGDGLALRNGHLLTADLLAAVADHKPALLALADLRDGAEQPKHGCAASPISAASPPVDYGPPASDVLSLLAQAGVPVPHAAILRGLIERGWTNLKARAAIEDCQGRGWIEHDLASGYVVSGGPE